MTGVQTCALPISSMLPSPFVCLCSPAPTPTFTTPALQHSTTPICRVPTKASQGVLDVLCTPTMALSPRFEPSCGKSTQVPLHEPFTRQTEFFQSCAIVSNHVIFFKPQCPPHHHSITPPLHWVFRISRSQSTPVFLS